MIKFNDKTLERFSRQIIIDKVGIKGQKKIVNTSLAIIGCGGLGTSAAQYLTMAGIGGVFLADDDIVSLSNLNRQTLFLESDLKKNKAETLAKKLIQINPKLNI
jgi:molybdopterin/thiamine biosynthesis adenylyltransferase